jgi:hypothetical protein
VGTAIRHDPEDPDTWAGRWVLVRDGRLRLDACGTLGVFYGAGWVSSSPALFAGEAATSLDRSRGHMGWYPPPSSGRAGVRRLLPSQELALADSSVTRRSLLPAPAAEPAERLVATIRGLPAGDVWLALTGGIDSRTVLAAAVGSGRRVTAFTFVDERTPVGDRELPPRLAKAVGVEHRRIDIPALDADALAAFDTHTSGHCIDGPRDQVAHRVWDMIPLDAAVLGGGCFELARAYYHDRVDDAPPTARGIADAVLARWGDRPEGVQAWAGWVADDPGDLDWRDRLYLEQRIAGWLSSNAQGIDLTGRRQVHIANDGPMIRGLLARPVAERIEREHQRAVIRHLAPALDDFPINPRQM